MKYSRRGFLKNMVGGTLVLSLDNFKFPKNLTSHSLKLGIIADLHQDIMHDSPNRLNYFINEMKKIGTDANIQLGDFAIPRPQNYALIHDFNQSNKHILHVIGNHDTDLGFTKEDVLKVWKMAEPYYSKEIKGIKIIVLDGNDAGSPTFKGGYPAYISNTQASWLENELKNANKPVLIFSHQPLAGPGNIDNAPEIRRILEPFSENILLCLNGHTHIDGVIQINGISYLHINSASYYWVGSNYSHQSYDENIHDQHPNISNTCPYRDPIYSHLEIDFNKKVLIINSKLSEWVGVSPNELNVTSSLEMKTPFQVIPGITHRTYAI
jgi:predicted phosphodiesterase